MRLSSVALLACSVAGGAMAQITDAVGSSVLSVLATAIPPDSISMALANPGSFAAAVASSISAGQTPAWYSSLPADVKSALPKLYPAAASVIASATASSTASSSPTSAVTLATSASLAPTGGNRTVISTVSSATLTSSRGANSASASPSTGAAAQAYPPAVFGAGIAGAIGFLGMLAM